MDLYIKIMNKKDTITSILEFQTDKVSDYWRNQLFNMYPFLDKEKCLNLIWEERKQYITSKLSTYYDRIKLNLQNKFEASQSTWLENKEIVNTIYSKVFGIDCFSILNNIIAEISLNPICPRNLRNNSFSFFWNADNNNFLRTTLHEMIHFIWFYIWQQHFTDNTEEYENPHIKWILSEMVIDTIIKYTEIGNLYPEPYKHHLAYEYFYDMKIDNIPILNIVAKIKEKSHNIEEFMERAYEYCLENEDSIRKQIL